MRIICRKGYYKFYPESVNELLLFADKYGELVQVKDYYTFPALAQLPDYSIKNQLYGGIVSLVNYASSPDRVFAQNKLKYDLESGTIKQNITDGKVGEHTTNYVWVVVGIPPVYAFLENKSVTTGFDGWLNVVKGYTLISRWEIENI